MLDGMDGPELGMSILGGDQMEVERIYTSKGYEKEYYHEFKFKDVFKHVEMGSQIQVVRSVFDINCGYKARPDWKIKNDLFIEHLQRQHTQQRNKP